MSTVNISFSLESWWIFDISDLLLRDSGIQVFVLWSLRFHVLCSCVSELGHFLLYRDVGSRKLSCCESCLFSIQLSFSYYSYTKRRIWQICSFYFCFGFHIFDIFVNVSCCQSIIKKLSHIWLMCCLYFQRFSVVSWYSHSWNQQQLQDWCSENGLI